MSSLVSPTLANTSVTTGMSISTSLRWSSRRTFFDWANDTTATGRTGFTVAPRLGTTSQVLLERLVRGVGLAARPEVLDRRHRGHELVGPHGLHPQAHAHLGGGDLLDEPHERDVRPVEEHLRADVGDLDRLALERHVDHAVRRHRPLVRQRHLLGEGHAVGGARPPRRRVHLAALGAALSGDAPLGESLQKARLRHARGVLVLEPHRGGDGGDGALAGCAPVGEGARVAHRAAPSLDPAGDDSGTKHSMSRMWPWRCDAGRQRGTTRIPVAMASGEPASTACSRAVSAPSRRTSAQAKGRSSGWPVSGRVVHAHVVTTPPGPTSTRSPVSAPVTGSYSVGGTTTVSPERTPRIRPSRSAVKKAPSTGPTERA